LLRFEDLVFSPVDDAFFKITEMNYGQMPPFINNKTQQDVMNTSDSPGPLRPIYYPKPKR
jgi:hypothetical protein